MTPHRRPRRSARGQMSSSSTRSRPCSRKVRQSAPGSVGQIRESTAQLARLAKIAKPASPDHRPRHQGRRHCRSEGHGAHGGHGALLRGRAAPRLPCIAGGQEPLMARRMKSASSKWSRRVSARWKIHRSSSWPNGRFTPAVRWWRQASRVPVRCSSNFRHWAASNAFGNPRRVANGVDYQRLMLLLAVMEKRLGLPLQANDVYVNVVGGLRLDEPAIDLAIVAAIASSLQEMASRTPIWWSWARLA